tara:strand:+ start:574 stop:777 length:204 start_codon:yes stop_codon:yes gene_type:complete
MVRVIIVFFLFYFWLSALVYADSHQLLPFPCDTEMGMVMDSLEVNPGCDKQNLPPDLFGEDREILEV